MIFPGFPGQNPCFPASLFLFARTAGHLPNPLLDVLAHLNNSDDDCNHNKTANDIINHFSDLLSDIGPNRQTTGDAPDAHGSLVFSRQSHSISTFRRPFHRAQREIPSLKPTGPQPFSCDPVHHRLSNHWMILLSVKKYTSFSPRYQYINTDFP